MPHKNVLFFVIYFKSLQIDPLKVFSKNTRIKSDVENKNIYKLAPYKQFVLGYLLLPAPTLR